LSVKYNGTDYYYIRNLQGDVTGIYNYVGSVVVKYAYDAWGKIISVTGSMTNTLGKLNPFRYRSYIYDEETGFYYLQSRYYDPEIGRFINADIFVSTGTGLNGFNMFAYCGNNPVSYIDSTGYRAVRLDNHESLSEVLSNTNPEYISYVTGVSLEHDNIYVVEATGKPNMTPRKDPRKGNVDRQKSNSRERNVAHPNGEEHSRVPKGNRGIKKVVAVGGLILSGGVVLFILVNDLSGIGIADDFALAPAIAIFWDCTNKLILR